MATIIKAMITCRAIHDIGSRALYSNVETSGLAARQFFTTIVSDDSFASFYSSFVRRLSFYSIDESDKFLTFPVLCEALLRLHGVRILAISLREEDCEFMHYCMLRYGIIRRSTSTIQAIIEIENGILSTVLSLPNVHTILLYGSVQLVDIVRFRPLTGLSISTWQSYEDLDRTLEHLSVGPYASRLLSINLRLKVDLDLEKVLLSLSEDLPNLEILRIEQYKVNTLVSCFLLCFRISLILFALEGIP